MKKIFILSIFSILMFVLCTSNISVHAENEPLPDFIDNFDSYEIGQCENIESFKEHWTNDYYSGTALSAKQQTNVSFIEYEDETETNKVLRVNNIVDDGSFFFITAASGAKYKNFTVTFRAKVLDCKAEAGGWFGINCRKENDTKYNDTNGMLLTFRTYQAVDEKPFEPQTYRYLPSTQLILSPETVSDYGKAATYETFENFNPNPENNGWVSYKIEVADTSYKLYADDVLVSSFTYDKKTVNIYGYLSFCVCVTDLLLDDFYLDNNDLEAPPVEEVEEKEEDNRTTQTKAKENKTTTANDAKNQNVEKDGCMSYSYSIFILPLLSLVLFYKKRRNAYEE